MDLSDARIDVASHGRSPVLAENSSRRDITLLLAHSEMKPTDWNDPAVQRRFDPSRSTALPPGMFGFRVPVIAH